MKYLLTLFLAFSAAVAWADGTVPLEDTYYFTFNTVAPSTGAPITMGGTPAIEIYEENGTTQITAGTTFAEDLDGVTGLHGVTLVCSAANGYEAGKWYSAVIAGTTPTADSVSVLGRTVARFRVVVAESTAGTPDVNAKAVGNNTTVPTSMIEMFATDWATAYDSTLNMLNVDISHAGGTAWGSGAITAGSIATGAIDSTALAANAIAVGTIEDNAITAAAIAADAIGSSEMAADAIGSSEVAAGALVAGTEITGLLTTGDITTGVWNAAAASYGGAGTYGQAVEDILVDTAEIGTAGAGLTNINLPNQTMDIVGNITGNLSGSVGSLTGHTVQTGDSYARLGAPAGPSVSADIAAIEAQTDDIGVAGAGLTAVSGSGGIEYTPTGGQIWYVDGTNDGSGDTGSRAAPFDTVGAAVTACASGDAICIAAGTYTEQVIVPNEKTNLEIYGTGWGTIIQYATVSTGGNEYDPVMKVSDGCYVHDIKINSSGVGQGLVNIDYDDYIGETDVPKNYVRVERVWADAEWDGMYFTDCKHITIRDCRIIATYDAINVSGSNGIIERCYIKTNGAYGTGASSKLARGLVWTQSTAGVVLTIRDTDISVPCTTDNDAGYIAGINVSDLVVTPTQSLTLDNVNIRASSTHASATAGVYGIYQSPDSGGFQANPVAIRMIGGSIVTSSVAAVTVQDIAAAQDANNVTTLIGSRVDISKCVGNVQVIDDDVAATLVDTGTSGVVIADDAITANKIATAAIGADELAASAITSSEAPNLDAAITTRASATVLGTPSGASIAEDIAAVDAGTSQVTADRVAKQVTFTVGSEGTESRNIVKLNAWSTGTRTLGFDFTELLKQMDTTLSTVDTVTVVQLDGSPSITTSSLRKHQNGMVALWNTAAITTANAGTYVVTVTVTTADSNTIVVTGTLEVE